MRIYNPPRSGGFTAEATGDPNDESLAALVEALRSALGDELRSIVLFGSAAENRQRAVSDTNVVIVLTAFSLDRVSAARAAIAPMRVALRARFLVVCSAEIELIGSMFAVKFADIQRRHRVLYGDDPFAQLAIPRAAALAQLRQAIINLVLRLRESWLCADGDAGLAQTAAEAAGGLRACAAELISLEGGSVASPRAALQEIAGGPLDELTAARTGELGAGVGAELARRLLEVAELMRDRASRLT